MNEFVEAWALLQRARRVEYREQRIRLVRAHYRILLAAWHRVRWSRPRPTLPELLVASGAVS